MRTHQSRADPGDGDRGEGGKQRYEDDDASRRGDEKGAERGDREEDRPEQKRLPAALPGENRQPEQAEGDEEPVQDLPGRLAHYISRPVGPDAADLGGDETG